MLQFLDGGAPKLVVAKVQRKAMAVRIFLDVGYAPRVHACQHGPGHLHCKGVAGCGQGFHDDGLSIIKRPSFKAIDPVKDRESRSYVLQKKGKMVIEGAAAAVAELARLDREAALEVL
jgi:hypothetical protein